MLRHHPALFALSIAVSSCGLGQGSPTLKPDIEGRFLVGVMSPSDGEVVSRRRFDGESGTFEVLSLLRHPTHIVGQRRAWAVLRTVEFACQPQGHTIVGVALFDELGTLLDERSPTVARYSGFDPLVAELCDNPDRKFEPEFTTIADYVEQARNHLVPPGSARVVLVPPAAPSRPH